MSAKFAPQFATELLNLRVAF